MKGSQALGLLFIGLMLVAVLPSIPSRAAGAFTESLDVNVAGSTAMWSVTFTGIRFENPFLLSSAPPTESESNILRAFEAGWGGVVTKTIGLHPVVNVEIGRAHV